MFQPPAMLPHIFNYFEPRFAKTALGGKLPYFSVG